MCIETLPEPILDAIARNNGDSLLRALSLLQSAELCLGFFQDEKVGVRFFPESEEVSISSEGTSAGGVGICSLRGSSF